MTQKKIIKYNILERFLNSVSINNLPNLIFIHGQQYLLKQSQDLISSYLLGQQSDKFALEILEGGAVSMGEIIEQVSTFSFFQSKKIVLVKNIPLFETRSKGSEIIFSQSEIVHFMVFIEKGIPENHYLILTTNNADKRKKVFKAIKEVALIIDCHISTGVRKVDLDEQRAVMQIIGRDTLSKVNKTLDPAAFVQLVELTGFDLELFSRNLEKLIVYAGTNQNITRANVDSVICRDKTDPIFNLTNALMEKDAKQALFYFNALLNKNFHILQLLKSLENQIRKLIMVKCCALELKHNQNIGQRKTCIRQINFNVFKQSILPGIIDYDKGIKQNIQELDDCFADHDSKKKKEQNKLLLAPNPKSAYPVFLIFQKSENFSQDELNAALIFLSDVDYRAKSSSFDVKTALENFIINLCR